MTSFHDFKAKKLDGEEMSFGDLAGKVVLIENTASL
jgi:glutathione peroxidase-family protein